MNIKPFELSYPNFSLTLDKEIILPKTGVVYINGESGSGKTCLMKRIAAANSDCFFSATGSYPPPSYTLAEILSSAIDHEPAKQTLIDQLDALLDFKAILKKRIKKLSGGYRGLVDLIAALISDKPSLLLDEPFDMMDHQMITNALKAVSLVSATKLIVLSSHRAKNTLKELAFQTIAIEEGRVEASAENKISSAPIVVDSSHRLELKRYPSYLRSIKDKLLVSGLAIVSVFFLCTFLFTFLSLDKLNSIANDEYNASYDQQLRTVEVSTISDVANLTEKDELKPYYDSGKFLPVNSTIINEPLQSEGKGKLILQIGQSEIDRWHNPIDYYPGQGTEQFVGRITDLTLDEFIAGNNLLPYIGNHDFSAPLEARFVFSKNNTDLTQEFKIKIVGLIADAPFFLAKDEQNFFGKNLSLFFGEATNYRFNGPGEIPVASPNYINLKEEWYARYIGSPSEFEMVKTELNLKTMTDDKKMLKCSADLLCSATEIAGATPEDIRSFIDISSSYLSEIKIKRYADSYGADFRVFAATFKKGQFIDPIEETFKPERHALVSADSPFTPGQKVHLGSKDYTIYASLKADKNTDPAYLILDRSELKSFYDSNYLDTIGYFDSFSVVNKTREMYYLANSLRAIEGFKGRYLLSEEQLNNSSIYYKTLAFKKRGMAITSVEFCCLAFASFGLILSAVLVFQQQKNIRKYRSKIISFSLKNHLINIGSFIAATAVAYLLFFLIIDRIVHFFDLSWLAQDYQINFHMELTQPLYFVFIIGGALILLELFSTTLDYLRHRSNGR